MKYLIFLSWSGVQSREYATIIKSFLMTLFGIKEKEIFFSSYTLNVGYTEGWFQKVRKSARESEISISCITTDNIHSPWIHYELGLSTGKLLPVLLDSHTLPEHLEMLTHQQMILCEKECNVFDVSHFTNILELIAKRLYTIFKDKLNDNPTDPNLTRYVCTSRINTEHHILNEHNRSLFEKSATELLAVEQKYNQKAWFISRPFAPNSDFHEVINNVCKDKDVHIADWSQYEDAKDTNATIPETRREQIANDKGFILVYPKSTSPTPSSCLIEFGMAFACHLKLHMLVEKDAKLPKFLDFFRASKSIDVQTYNNYQELRALLSSILK